MESTKANSQKHRVECSHQGIEGWGKWGDVSQGEQVFSYDMNELET